MKEVNSRLPFDAHLFMNYEAICALVTQFAGDSTHAAVDRMVDYGWGL